MADQQEIKEVSKTYDLEQDILTHEEALECLIKGEDVVKLPVASVKACETLNDYFSRSTAKKNRNISSSSSTLSKTAPPFNSRRDITRSLITTDHEKSFSVPLVRNFDKILKKPKDICPQESSALLSIISNKQKKTKPDIFSRLERLEQSKGPLLHLKNNVDKIVKVLIRRRRKVPYVSRTIEYKGTLVLFDKHINLYLKDVIESFKYQLDGKIMKRARHRERMFIRGDNVILVSDRDNQHQLTQHQSTR